MMTWYPDLPCPPVSLNSMIVFLPSLPSFSCLINNRTLSWFFFHLVTLMCTISYKDVEWTRISSLLELCLIFLHFDFHLFRQQVPDLSATVLWITAKIRGRERGQWLPLSYCRYLTSFESTHQNSLVDFQNKKKSKHAKNENGQLLLVKRDKNDRKKPLPMDPPRTAMPTTYAKLEVLSEKCVFVSTCFLFHVSCSLYHV